MQFDGGPLDGLRLDKEVAGPEEIVRSLVVETKGSWGRRWNRYWLGQDGRYHHEPDSDVCDPDAAGPKKIQFSGLRRFSAKRTKDEVLTDLLQTGGQRNQQYTWGV